MPSQAFSRLTETSPVVECTTNSVTAFTSLRLYLIPIDVYTDQPFNTYRCIFDLNGGAPNVDYKFGLYQQVDKISSSGVAAVLVANTTASTTGETTTFTAKSLTNPVWLEKGNYWIGFVFEEQGTTIVNSRAEISGGVPYIKGNYVYQDLGSLTLSSTINGTGAGSNRFSYIWSAPDTAMWLAIADNRDTNI